MQVRENTDAELDYFLPGIMLWEAINLCNAPLCTAIMHHSSKNTLGTSFLREFENTGVLWFKYLLRYLGHMGKWGLLILGWW